MRLRVFIVAAVVIVAQGAYLRHVEQRHRAMVADAIAHVEARVHEIELSTIAQLSPAGGWRRDVKRRLKRIERCCCPGTPG